jgi:hypothetical protein
VNDRGEARSTHGRDEKPCKIFIEKTGGKKQKEDLGIDGKEILLEWVLGK